MLEPRQLYSATLLDSPFDSHDHGPGCACGCQSHTDQFGNEYHALPEYDASLEAPGIADDGTSPYLELAPLSETFFLNSNPGASHTVYLDFDGHTTSGTSWNNAFNGGQDFYTPPYSYQGDSSFSDSELTRIQYIWQRVAEDFMPFDVNITTQDPGEAALRRSGSGDTEWGVRVVIGGSSYDWYGNGAGGVAYVGSFNSSLDTPTYAFTSQLGNGSEKSTAEAVSHEIGHTLGLRHDGTSSTTYYRGHGSGETGWAAIMGVGYYENLTQWSKGEYNDANRTEDDLNIITTRNGFGYRADDHGDSLGPATTLTPSGNSISETGIIERNTDFDVFSFSTGTGNVVLNIDPAARGANLDILAELLDNTGQVIATSNPANDLSSSFSQSLDAGNYYLRISGTGKGDPLGTGYTDYGSLGQYTINGSVQPPDVEPSLSINDISVDEDGRWANFTVSLSEASSETVSVLASTGDIDTSAGNDYRIKSQTLVFNPGETSKTFAVSLINDRVRESDEDFVVDLSGAVNATISDGQGVGTIVDNDTPAAFMRLFGRRLDEPDLFNDGSPRTRTMPFQLTLSSPLNEDVSVDWTTADETATAGVDYIAASGTATIAAGQTSTFITVDLLGDLDFEGNEQFRIQLANPVGAPLANARAFGTILDNDFQQRGNDQPQAPDAAEAGLDQFYSVIAYQLGQDNQQGEADAAGAAEQLILFESGFDEAVSALRD